MGWRRPILFPSCVSLCPSPNAWQAGPAWPGVPLVGLRKRLFVYVFGWS
jgi:hypothetical protein